MHSDPSGGVSQVCPGISVFSIIVKDSVATIKFHV